MPVYCPAPAYPSIWERLTMFGRKNGSKQKPQKPRKVKGRRKPEHRGGAAPKGGKK